MNILNSIKKKIEIILRKGDTVAGTGNGGGGNDTINEEFALCVYISFRTLRKNTFVIYFHYANTYLCASLPTCHVLSYDFTSFSLHQG